MKMILVVDDELTARQLTRECLEQSGYSVEPAQDGKEALKKLSESTFDLAILDLKLPDMSGLDILKECRKDFPEMPVLMLTGHATVETAVEAMKEGALDYISKPFNLEELRVKVRKALENKQMGDLNRFLLGALEQETGVGGLVGQSGRMKEVYSLIEQIAKVDSSVLLLGESGTGKELVAHAIHHLSLRQNKPFVKANCSAFAIGVLESELFGHEKGAFTGAVARQLGRFEVADSGTIFLDEIGDLPLEIQVKFLRVLEEKVFERVGSSRPIQVDVRIVSATNRNLQQLVREGKFRNDLYYRLNVMSIHLPALRERKEDLPLLAEHFIQKYSREVKKDISKIEPGFLECLTKYDWPGNVRELENAVERAVVLAKDNTLLIHNLPLEIQVLASNKVAAFPSSLLQTKEREIIEQVLRDEQGNKIRAARRLGMGRTTLWRKIKEYQIDLKKIA